MDRLAALVIIKRACRQNPELAEAIAFMKNDHISLGDFYASEARRFSQCDASTRLNRTRAVTTAERHAAIRAVYRSGMNGEAVRQALMAAGEVYPLRSIQRDLKKLNFI